jgi:hypothetical protein
MVANLKFPTLGIPASSGAGGCQRSQTMRREEHQHRGRRGTVRESERHEKAVRPDVARDATPRATGVGFRPCYRIVITQYRVAFSPGLQAGIPCLN